MVFTNEGVVRTFVRRMVPGVRWIEFAGGGTEGLPDCFLPGDGGKIEWWCELKLGSIVGDRLKMLIRPAQKRELKALLDLGHIVLIGVGIKKGAEIMMLKVDGNDIEKGWIKLSELAQKTVAEGQLGVNWNLTEGLKWRKIV